MKTISAPTPEETIAYFYKYVELVPGDNLLISLKDVHLETQKLLAWMSEEQGNFSYAPGKWTAKQLLVHLIDCERIFCYRALRFARNDNTDLLGFEEDDFAAASGATERTLDSIAKEFATVRSATISLFESFDEAALMRVGHSGGNPMSVRACGYVLLGHEMHHIGVLRERYLKQATA